MKNLLLSKHEKSFIKGELYNYNNNLKKLKELQDDIIYSSSANDGQPKGNGIVDQVSLKAEKLISSKSILIVTDKIQKIQNAINRLSEDDKESYEIIFNKGCNQVYAQMNYGISKDMYYGAMNRIIKAVAIEYGFLEGKK